MSFHPFSIANLSLVLLSAALLVYYIYVWRKLKQNVPQQEFSRFKKPVVRFAAVYTAFIVILCLLAANHFFQVVTLPPRFVLIFLPLILAVVILTRAKQTQSLSFLSFIPPATLIIIHVYRLMIELAFIQFANEKIIPVELSIYGRNYDLWIGVLALPAGYLVGIRNAWSNRVGIVFNMLGLLSLVNIFSIVIPSIPSPFRVYQPMQLASYFPGVLIVFLASSAIFLHILSLRQLVALQKMGKTNNSHSVQADTNLLLPE